MANPTSPCSSLYVGDLHPDVTEAILYDKFQTHGNVLSIRVCRDLVTRKSLGYAYVNYQTSNEAESAMKNLTFEDINGQSCKIMWSKRNPVVQPFRINNIFINNLNIMITVKEIQNMFANFGEILSCEMHTDKNGLTKGLTFVNFNREEDAEKAIQVIHGKFIRDNIVYVAKLHLRNHENPLKKGFTKCCIKNLATNINDDILKTMFEAYGEIVSAQVMIDEEGVSKGFGFISFKKHGDAVKAVKSLNGKVIENKKIYVGRAMKKSEEKRQSGPRYKKTCQKRLQQQKSSVNLYTKKLRNDINDDRLSQEFTVFGNIASANVVLNKENNTLIGFRFLCFLASNEATPAVTELNCNIGNGKSLCMALAKKKENSQMEMEMHNQTNVKTMLKIPNADTMEAKQILRQKLYPLISEIAGDMTNPIIEMILQLDNSEIHDLIENENFLRMKVEEILVLLNCDKGENEESEVINILLLGETGVGKSTWLNGLINYLTYPSLDDAAKGEPISLIRSQFTITNSNYESEKVIYGNDDDTNEAFGSIGHSVTQMPKSYTFNIKNKRIRIIDTPGIGDTDGIEKDQLNMHNIVAYLSNFKDVNGIIVLLRPNEPRLTVTFKFCIQQLLLYLHKDACNNMVFCFTNCRSTFYKPGETLPVLKALLDKIKSIDIKLNKDTIYCMDNESIRFLMAMKTITFEDSEQIEYAASWKKAVEESTRLIQYISNLPPHSTQKTVSINEARRSIINQSRPIAHIAECIQNNINAIKSKQMENISIKSSKAQLHNQLKVKYSTLKIKHLDYPRTVCTAEKCIEVVSNQYHYKTICHEHCYIETDPNIVRCVALQKCWAMEEGNSTDKCRICSCSWEHHMHITYDMEVETVMKEDESIKQLIDGKDGNLKINEDIQKRLQDKVNRYNKDKQRLIEINAHFACFLKRNAIIPYNDALIDYLDHLIKIKKVEPDFNKDKIENLESLRNVYRQEIEVIEKACGTNSDVGQSLDANKVDKLMSELKQLPSITEIFPNGWSDIDKANFAAVKQNDKHIIVKPKGVMPECVENLYHYCTNWRRK